MSITEKFLALDVPEQAGLLLALAVILVPLCVWGVRAFIAYAESQPIYDPMVHGPEDLHAKLQGVRSEYEADQIVGEYNRAEAQALADHLRGTKL